MLKITQKKYGHEKLGVLLLAGLVSLNLSQASAAEGQFLLGLGLQYEDVQYIGQDKSIDALPYIAYETERLHIGIDEISYKIVTQDIFELALFAEPRSLNTLKEGSQFED